MNNIEKLGTVIKANGIIYPLVEGLWVFNGKHWHDIDGYRASTKDLTDITVIHEGYTPPVEEPEIGTVIKDKYGNVLKRYHNGVWYMTGTSTIFYWNDISQTVPEIIWPKQDSE